MMPDKLLSIEPLFASYSTRLKYVAKIHPGKQKRRKLTQAHQSLQDLMETMTTNRRLPKPK